MEGKITGHVEVDSGLGKTLLSRRLALTTPPPHQPTTLCRTYPEALTRSRYYLKKLEDRLRVEVCIELRKPAAFAIGE